MIKKDNLTKFEIALRGLNVNIDAVIGEMIYTTVMHIEKGNDVVPQFMLETHTKIFNRRVAIQQQKIIKLLKPLTDKPEELSKKLARMMMGEQIEEENEQQQNPGPEQGPVGGS